MPARVLALTGAGLGLSLLGLARDTGPGPVLAYGNALMVCAAFYLLVAWVWHLRLDGVAFLNPGRKKAIKEPDPVSADPASADPASVPDAEKAAEARKREASLDASLAIAGAALLALALAFQYLPPLFT